MRGLLQFRFSIKDTFSSIGILLLASLAGACFRMWNFNEANIIAIYILCVLVISVVTDGTLYGIAASLLSVVIFNFLFAEPVFTLQFYSSHYVVTFLVMFIVSLIASALTTQVKIRTRNAERIAMQAKQEELRANLLRSISHDLRTPLTSISGNASILVNNYDVLDEEKKKRLYLDIYDDSMWLINLVENLLSVTRIEDGKMSIHMQPELLEEVIQEALSHINRNSSQHHIAISLENDLLMAQIDSRLIVQVIINIVDNAIKYTHAGSNIEISAKKAEDMVLVEIANDGDFIPDAIKDKLFDSFYSAGYSDGRRGFGLGLFLCKAIIAAHCGSIGVRDNSPRGSIFYFTLKAQEVTDSEQTQDPGSRG